MKKESLCLSRSNPTKRDHQTSTKTPIVFLRELIQPNARLANSSFSDTRGRIIGKEKPLAIRLVAFVSKKITLKPCPFPIPLLSSLKGQPLEKNVFVKH